MTGIHVAEDVCAPVAHRQVVFTIPKRLRIHARFDRELLGKLSSCAWNCIKAEVETSAESFSESEENAADTAATRCSQTWAMLIKRVYEVDPLSCPQCGGQMKVVAFIEPPQHDVIEKILEHLGLWQVPAPRAPPDMEDLVLELDASYSDSSTGFSDQADQPQELTYVDIDTFLATF